MRKVIAFCGKAGSGKDYSASRLFKTMGFKVVAYADALRDVAFSIIGLPFETGMKCYDKLKQTELINGQTFRNMLENLGSGVRKYDEDFWARTVLKHIKDSQDNIAISDLRYANEYSIIKEYCEKNNIDFKLVFCNYKSERYQEENSHESAKLAEYLCGLGYNDQEYVDDYDMQVYINMEKANK